MDSYLIFKCWLYFTAVFTVLGQLSQPFSTNNFICVDTSGGHTQTTVCGLSCASLLFVQKIKMGETGPLSHESGKQMLAPPAWKINRSLQFGGIMV